MDLGAPLRAAEVGNCPAQTVPIIPADRSQRPGAQPRSGGIGIGVPTPAADPDRPVELDSEHIPATSGAPAIHAQSMAVSYTAIPLDQAWSALPWVSRQTLGVARFPSNGGPRGGMEGSQCPGGPGIGGTPSPGVEALRRAGWRRGIRSGRVDGSAARFAARIWRGRVRPRVSFTYGACAEGRLPRARAGGCADAARRGSVLRSLSHFLRRLSPFGQRSGVRDKMTAPAFGAWRSSVTGALEQLPMFGGSRG